jgi:ERCC4-type nuclease
MSNSKRPSNKNKTEPLKGNSQKDMLILIDKVTESAEEKILLENSIKSIIKGADNIAEHIKLMDKEKTKEIIEMYNKILDGLKQKSTNS